MLLSSKNSLAQSEGGEQIKAESTAHMPLVYSDDNPAAKARSMHGVLVHFIPRLDNSYAGIGIEYRRGSAGNRGRHIRKREWSGGIRFSQFIDSRNDRDYGVALGASVLQHIGNISSLSILAKLGFDADYVWRDDDDDRFVNTFLFSIYPGLNVEMLMSEKTGFVLSTGYRLATNSDWQRPGKTVVEGSGEESRTTPGLWLEEEPKIKMSGFFLTFGLKFFL
ncbi:MAG: hypothetical protein ACE5I1_04185 [bacterium]